MRVAWNQEEAKAIVPTTWQSSSLRAGAGAGAQTKTQDSEEEANQGWKAPPENQVQQIGMHPLERLPGCQQKERR